MKKTYIASAMIHAMSALKSMVGVFGSSTTKYKANMGYQHPSTHGGKRTGFATAKRMAKKNRNIRARAKK